MSSMIKIIVRTMTLTDFFSQDFSPYSDIFLVRKNEELEGNPFQIEILNDVPQKAVLQNKGCVKLLILDTKEFILYERIPKADLTAALLKCLTAGNERDCSENISNSEASSIRYSFHFSH